MALRRADCLYTSHYCEENIWHLCQDAFFDDHDCRVVFVSNSERCVAYYEQGIVDWHDAVLWDYHVILFVERDDGWVVYDHDSRLPFPCRLRDYICRSFRHIPSPARPAQFRVIPAADFVQHFASDRRHMQEAGGSYLQPPPTWPTIGPINKVHFNLWDFVNMEDEGLGEVYDYDSVLKRFG